MALLVAVTLLPAAALAQTDNQPGVVVTTNPPGAQVTLDGEVTVSGVTPAHFRQLLVGDYRLRVEKDGWESYTSRLVVDPTTQLSVNVDLSRKTRFKAAMRSFFVPGWGQKYAGESTKATTFFLAALGSGVAFLMADERFDDKYADFTRRRDEYDAILNGGAEADLEEAYRALVDAQDEARDAEDIRRVTIGVAAGVWALNMLDVLFFFPKGEGTFSIKGLAVAPGAVNGGAGVTLSANF